MRYGRSMADAKGNAIMRKRELRHEADAAVRVWRGDKAYRATAVNLSAGGVTLAGMEPLPLNSWITVSLLQRNIRARVAWVLGDEMGVSFLSRLSAAQLKAVRQALGHDLDAPGSGHDI